MKQFLSFVLLSLLAIIGVAQETKPVFSINPYLQVGYRPAAGSLDLLWAPADSAAVFQVEYRKDGSGGWTKASIANPKTIAVANLPKQILHHASLTGLVAGSMFDYRLLLDSKVVYSATAHAPKDKTQPYRFIVFGDVGAGSKEAVEIAKGVYQSKPDLVLIPGDIVYDNGLVSEYNKRFWPIYNTSVPEAAGVPLMSSVPFVAAVGNHDLVTRDLDRSPDALAYYYYWQQPLNAPAGKEGVVYPALKGSEERKKQFIETAGEAYPSMANFSYDYANAHWLVLDADSYVDWTDKELLDWVNADLAKAKDAQWRFVMFHHPGFNSSRAHFGTTADAFTCTVI